MDEDARKLAVAAAEGELADAVSALRDGQYAHAADHLSNALSHHPSLAEAYAVLDDLTVAAGSADPFPLDAVDAVPVGTIAGQAHLRAASGAYDSAVLLLLSGIAARPDLDWSGVPWFDDALLADRLTPAIWGGVLSVAGSVDEPTDGGIPLRLLRLVRRIIARHPYHHQLLAAGSALARPLGRYQEAVDWATRAERIEPSKQSALLLARAYGALGQVTDAEAAWLRAISRDATDVCLLHELADWLGGAGRLGDGIRYAERTLAVDPEHTHGLVTLHALRYQRDGDVRHLVALAGIARAGADGGLADRRLAAACDGAAWLNRVPRPVDAASALLDQLLAGARDDARRPATVVPPSATLAAPATTGEGSSDAAARKSRDADAGGPNRTPTDARRPLRAGRYCVWRFEGSEAVPAVAAPSAAAAEAVRRLPTRWWPHPPAAYDRGVYLSGLSLDDLLGLLVHPPEPPADRVGQVLAQHDRALWVRLVQAWTCLGIAHYRGDEPWPSSLRREVLTDLVFGPEDWVTEAALFALVATGWVVPRVRTDVADVVAERIAHAAAAARHREVPIASSLATLALATPGLPEGALRTATWLLAAADAQLLDGATPVAPLAPRPLAHVPPNLTSDPSQSALWYIREAPTPSGCHGARRRPSCIYPRVVFVFVHEARLALGEGADEYAPGAAVTVALCGHWEHDGPCRWPHHTGIDERWGRAITVRTAFRAEQEDEQLVRERIVAALRSGYLEAPKGASSWTLLNEGPAPDRASGTVPHQTVARQRLLTAPAG